MNLIQRASAPTPKFFKKVRNISLILAAVSGTLLATPVALPLVVVKIAGYLAVAGSVASAVSQVTTEDEDQKGVTDEYRLPF
jgi:energy-converting hydrogenase Eha subunit G